MSPKEEIRKLNEDLWNALGILAEATKGQEDARSATQDYLNRAVSLGGKFVRETKLPYHSSFTTAEMAGTEEVRLLTADNSGWNRAVDDIQSKQREYLGE